jgi:glycosyltransferase involved in cell wall biosynthesis
MKLKIAAKIDDYDRAYYEGLSAKFKQPWVEFVGEVNEAQKNDLLRNAYALLFPIDWPEPFGLAMVEAMSCGTPVIAWPHGSVPEIVEDGKTGYIVNTIQGAVKALERVASLDRRRVAKRASERFCARRMALDYVRLYERCIELQQPMPILKVGAGGGRHARPR